jgi:hypothetical protein
MSGPLLFADQVNAERRGAMVALTLGEGDAARTFVMSHAIAERLAREVVASCTKIREDTADVLRFPKKGRGQ